MNCDYIYSLILQTFNGKRNQDYWILIKYSNKVSLENKTCQPFNFFFLFKTEIYIYIYINKYKPTNTAHTLQIH